MIFFIDGGKKLSDPGPMWKNNYPLCFYINYWTKFNLKKKSISLPSQARYLRITDVGWKVSKSSINLWKTKTDVKQCHWNPSVWKGVTKPFLQPTIKTTIKKWRKAKSPPRVLQRLMQDNPDEHLKTFGPHFAQGQCSWFHNKTITLGDNGINGRLIRTVV